MTFDKTTELHETINDIIEDVILIEAMLLRMEQRSSAIADLPQERMEQTFSPAARTASNRVGTAMCFRSQYHTRRFPGVSGWKG